MRQDAKRYGRLRLQEPGLGYHPNPKQGGGAAFAALTSKANVALTTKSGTPLDTGAAGSPAYYTDFVNSLIGTPRTQLASSLAALLYA